MLHNKNIICVSTIDWDFVWQGHQEIMSILAKNGNRVLFIENTGVRAPTIKDIPRLWNRFVNWRKGFRGIRQERENLYIYSPLTLPFPYSKIARRINKKIMLSVIKRWMISMEFHNPIVWSFLPTGLVLDILSELDPSIFIYYCIDDFASSSKGARKIRRVEEKVTRRADLVFTTSHKLYERCKAINAETYLFPFGINVENYNRIRGISIEVPAQMRDIKRPIIGYVGGIHKWVDTELLKRIASRRNDISIVLIGPKQIDISDIDKIKNIFFLGKKEGYDLPKYVKFFDAGIIPYKMTPYTENVYPTKINEYLAMGKPVIATRIPEVLEFAKENGQGFIYFIENEKEIDDIIDNLPSQNDKDIIDKRIVTANKNSWLIKIESMCDLIEKRLRQLGLNVNRDWLERLRRIYRRARRRTIKIASTALITYLALFYSPLMWYVAAPLKISQAPQKADAIVVFGGGVGETGSPGKSTIERARYSADLYKSGFAKHIIYSSGYTYKYNDAENMKLVAMSMGVPEKNIILEENGNFTYENVKYIYEILKNNGFRKILLVSSPYNMRRAALVFDHIAKDINVVYTPVVDPQFYAKGRAVKLEQIRAIIHEYLGIIYYFLKGYI